MLECPKDPTLQPGTWNLWTTGKRQVLFCCPTCGHVALLDKMIADDGMVTRSIQCGKAGCSFNQRIRLVGWKPQKETDE